MTIKKFTPIKDIALTPKASQHINSILLKDANKNKRFRIYITGGGCSGFEYGFMLDEKQNDDLCINTVNTEVIIDKLSMQYLRGATLDYARDLSGAKFSIKNPNATTTCSCGSSFTI